MFIKDQAPLSRKRLRGVANSPIVAPEEGCNSPVFASPCCCPGTACTLPRPCHVQAGCSTGMVRGRPPQPASAAKLAPALVRPTRSRACLGTLLLCAFFTSKPAQGSPSRSSSKHKSQLSLSHRLLMLLTACALGGQRTRATATAQPQQQQCWAPPCRRSLDRRRLGCRAVLQQADDAPYSDPLARQRAALGDRVVRHLAGEPVSHALA